MRKAIVCLVCILGSALAFAQAAKALPAVVDAMKFSEKPSGIYAYETIRPVGWSKDGKFAYISQRAIEGRGGTRFAYMVYDTVNDLILSSAADDSFDWDEAPDDAAAQAAVSWERNRDTFLKVLDKHRITMGVGLEFRKCPYVKDKEIYDARLKPSAGRGEDGRVFSYSVVITSSLKGSKLIYKLDPGEMSEAGLADSNLAVWAWVCGYFMSPYENRMLVVIGEEKPGFEGNEGFFVFSGASLDKRFTR